MPSTTRNARRAAAGIQAHRLAEAEAAADAARIGAKARQRQAAAEVADLAVDLAAAGVILTAEAAAEVLAAEAEAAERRNAPIHPADRTRMDGRAILAYSSQAAWRALAAARRQGWKSLSTGAMRELAPDVAAEVATLATAEAKHADARRWYLAPYGTPRADALRRMMLTGAELGPRWDAPPRPAAKREAAAWDAAQTDQDRWRAAMLAEAVRIVRRYRTEAEHGASRADGQATRAAQTADRYAVAMADRNALAGALADAGRPLAPREARAVLAAVDGLTSRERAQLTGSTPGAERVAASKGRAALAERWPNRAALAADLAAAKRARQTAAEEDGTAVVAHLAAAEAPTAARGVLAYLAAIEKGHTVRHAAEILRAAARLAATRPARRACYRYAPRADRRTVVERMRQDARHTAPTAAAAVLIWMDAAEHLALTEAAMEAHAIEAARCAEDAAAQAPRPVGTAPAYDERPVRRTRDAAPVNSVPNDLAAATARALAESTEQYSRTRLDVDRAMARRAAAVQPS